MNIALIIILISGFYIKCVLCALSTFRTEVLNITPPPQLGTILDEAIWLMRRHFLHRKAYKDSDWDELRRKYSSYSDQHVALRHFMESFGDPYTRYIPEKQMTVRQRSIRGHTVGLGLQLCKKFHYYEIGLAIRQYIPKIFSYKFNDILKNNEYKSLPTITDNDIHKHKHKHEHMPSINKVWSKLLLALPKFKLLGKGKSNNFNILNNENQMSISRLNNTFVTLSEQIRFTIDTVVPVVSVIVYSAFHKNTITLKRKIIIGVASFAIICISAARRLMPLIYPIEIIDANTTALNSQIQLGDRILAIDEKVINGWSLKKVNEFLEDGHEDDSVTLHIIRPQLNKLHMNSSEVLGYTKLDIVVNRKRMLTKKVKTKVLPETQGLGLGYLSIEEFTDNTLYEVTNAMEELDNSIYRGQKRHLKALIIDLRGNPGGPLPPALDLAALFLPRGKIITQMGIQGQCEIHKSLNPNPNRSLSLLVLADSNTASASEIFIASLQDNARAKCMGTRTVGKNVAQAMMMLSDGSGLAFTVREYHSPLGNSMVSGIKPDIEIQDNINIEDINFDIKNVTWSLNQATNFLKISK